MFEIITTDKAYRIARQKWMGSAAEYGEILESIPDEAIALELWRRRLSTDETQQYFEQFDGASENAYEN